MKTVNIDDVLKILHKYGEYIFLTDEKRYSSMIDEIVNLKALEQEPKTGHWIEVHPLQEDDGGAYMCSKCRCGHPYIAPHWKYCPNCGAEMTERGEE